MIKLQNILTENYGGPGEMVLPPNHKAGLKVPKGGSCCANCKWWNKKEQICNSTYYVEWAGTNKIPYAADAYRDWETDRKSTRLNSSH